MFKPKVTSKRKIRNVLDRHWLIPCLLASLLLIISGCGSESIVVKQPQSGTAMVEANRLYESGAYEEAVQKYQALVDDGVMDGAVYYNLGNAFFKSGDLGRAILNYRRARRLLPRDSDIATNLQLARAQTRDRLEIEQNGMASFVRYILVGWSTLDEVAAVALGLWVLLCGGMLLDLIWNRYRLVLRWILRLLTLGLVLSVLSLSIQVSDAQRLYAVVVAQNIEVRSGPGTDYLVEFSLHTGAEVRVVEYRNAWTRITLPGNLQGWVPDEAVERIIDNEGLF